MNETSVVFRVCRRGSGNHFLWCISNEQFFTRDRYTLPPVTLVDLLRVRSEPPPISVETHASRVSLGDQLRVTHFFHDNCALLVCHLCAPCAADSPSP